MFKKSGTQIFDSSCLWQVILILGGPSFKISMVNNHHWGVKFQVNVLQEQTKKAQEDLLLCIV